MLQAGAGPRPPAGARSPDCGGELRGCWRGYERTVRFARRVERLRIGRSRCRRCGRTHALLPSFLVPRRLDWAPVIGAALERAAAGHGQRPSAAAPALPQTTVRGWLRRARARAALTAARLWRFAQELGALAPRPRPGQHPLAAPLGAAAAARAAAARRFGGAGLPDRLALVLVLCGEGLFAAHKLALGGGRGGREDRPDR